MIIGNCEWESNKQPAKYILINVASHPTSFKLGDVQERQ